MTGLINSSAEDQASSAEGPRSNTERRKSADGSLATAFLTTTVESVATATRAPGEVLYCLSTGKSSREVRQQPIETASRTDGSLAKSAKSRGDDDRSREKFTESREDESKSRGISAESGEESAKSRKISAESRDWPSIPQENGNEPTELPVGSRADFRSGGKGTSPSDDASTSSQSDEEASEGSDSTSQGVV